MAAISDAHYRASRTLRRLILAENRNGALRCGWAAAHQVYLRAYMAERDEEQKELVTTLRHGAPTTPPAE